MTYLSNIVRSPGDPKIIRSGPSSLGTADRLARALGWFSIGLGLMELIAPHRITRTLGMEGQESLIRAYGAREIGSGILSLSIDKQVGLWSRVAGDGLDVATVMPAMRDDNPKRDNVGLALAMLLGVMALDVIAAQSVTSRHSRGSRQWRDYSDRSGFPRGIESARSQAHRRPGSRHEGPGIAAVH
ncbi:hypothetical protein KEU06_17730 [Pseudaminobacter sp. 19-2017]|uniref:Uncharacterized protein n=1 Tax=Pseudaminobacter soli (ex Zhang et al. 2022) TaxID=2831468 RepID=A0A942DZU1_9HYPH|nr:hypothetical protein [Pseudaminobacter soli]MBS3650458.1 hypothetical protein [Pseudaminobacter soli]